MNESAVADTTNTEFEKWLSTQNIDDPNQKYRNDLEREFCIGFGKGYREAASDAWKVQQEKIDKLERELAQQRFNNTHNLSIDQKVVDEIGKLKSENKLLQSWVKHHQKTVELKLKEVAVLKGQIEELKKGLR